VISSVGEYGDEEGATTAFDALTTAIADEGARAVDEPPAIGEQTALHTDTTDVLSYDTSRSTLTFRSGRYVGSVDVAGPADDEIPVATMETLGQRLAKRIEVADSKQATDLSRITLKLDLPAEDYIERYDVLDGDVLRTWGETESAYATRAESLKDIERMFRRDEGLPDDDKPLNEVPRFSVSLFQFSDPDTASAWVRGVPARRNVVPVVGARQFGDESLTVAEAYEWDGTSRTGFRIYIRLGSIVANPTIDGPDAPELSVLEGLAALQEQCLVAGSCPSPVAVPAELLP